MINLHKISWKPSLKLHACAGRNLNGYCAFKKEVLKNSDYKKNMTLITEFIFHPPHIHLKMQMLNYLLIIIRKISCLFLSFQIFLSVKKVTFKSPIKFIQHLYYIMFLNELFIYYSCFCTFLTSRISLKQKQFSEEDCLNFCHEDVIFFC